MNEENVDMWLDAKVTIERQAKDILASAVLHKHPRVMVTDKVIYLYDLEKDDGDHILIHFEYYQYGADHYGHLRVPLSVFIGTDSMEEYCNRVKEEASNEGKSKQAIRSVNPESKDSRMRLYETLKKEFEYA